MSENDEIAKEIELERLRIEQEKLKPKPISRNQVEEAKWVWVSGTILVDLLTAYLIYAITSYWYYAGLWALAGAGGLIYSERLKGRIGNNSEQTRLSERGVKTSAIAVVAMAIIVGAMWVTKMYDAYLFALIEASSVGLFFFHLWQSYQFQHKDDGYIADNEEARLEEANNKRIREAHRASRIVNSRKTERGVKENYRKEHGAAFDAVIGDKPVRQFGSEVRKNDPNS